MIDYELGKIAYEAYCETTGWKSAVTGADLPPFEKTPEAVQKGWIAAAKAVKDSDTLIACIKCGSLFPPSSGLEGLKKGVCPECFAKEMGSGT